MKDANSPSLPCYRSKEQKFYLNPISTSHAGEYICTVHTVDDTTATAALTLKLQGRKYWIGDSKMRSTLLSLFDFSLYHRFIPFENYPSVFLSVFMFQIYCDLHVVIRPLSYLILQIHTSFFGEPQNITDIESERYIPISLRRDSYPSSKVTFVNAETSLSHTW